MNNFFLCNKIIYQTYECEFKELHTKFKENANAWIDLHPDWEYRFSSAEKRREEIIPLLNLSKDGIIAYDSANGLAQSDMWRLAITGKQGGMWADLDSVPLVNLTTLIDKVDKKVDLIAGPEGYQMKGKGSNLSNFIFGKDTFLGNEISSIIYEFLEMGGYLIKKNEPTLFFNGMTVWPDFVDRHRDRVAQIFGPEYYHHSSSLKAPSDYTGLYEKPKLMRQRTECPTIYTKEWQDLFRESQSSL